MEMLNKSNLKEIVDADVSMSFKIIAFVHSVETDLSEVVYKSWCRLTGGKFERNESSSNTSCFLVTKRTTHLFTNSLRYLSSLIHLFRFVFRKKDSVTFSLYEMRVKELEVFELKCPEGATFGEKTVEHNFRFKKKEDCVYCGRCLEVQDEDRKIAGKF